MKKKLTTTNVTSEKDALTFFDQSAETYSEAHGNARKLLQYRLGLIESNLNLNAETHLLDLGCGNGIHLFPLAKKIGFGLGLDFSPEMIKAANNRLGSIQQIDNLEFRVSNAANLDSVESEQFDSVICIGAFEHMLDKKAVLSEIFRALKKGGRLFILTPNGGYTWYSRLAKRLNLDITHLSTDQFLHNQKIAEMLQTSGFSEISIRGEKEFS